MSDRDLLIHYPHSLRTIAIALVTIGVALPFLVKYVEWRPVTSEHLGTSAGLLVAAALWLLKMSESACVSEQAIVFTSWVRKVEVPWEALDSIDQTRAGILFFLKDGRRFSLSAHARNAAELWARLVNGTVGTQCRNVFGRPRQGAECSESDAYEVTFETSDALIRRSIRRMALEYLKIGAPAGLIVWLVVAIALRSLAASDLVFGAWLGFLILTAGWTFFLHVHHIKRLESLQRRLPSRVVHLTILPDGLRVDHALGINILPWSVYRVLVQHRDVWFLYYSSHDFLILPVEAFGSREREFIETHLKASGGRVVAPD
jgi:hypothetical protein